MKLKRTVLGPILIALVALLSGGWLLQRGAAAEGDAFRSARIFDEVLSRVMRDYVDEHPSDELYQMAVEGLLRELGDPHTSFMTAAEYAELRTTTTGEYGGLGIQIGERDGWITVIAPLSGTPAERAGILAGDRIVEVDGESTEGWSDDDAVNELRGPVGEPVDIEIARPGVGDPIPFRLVREEIRIESVPAAFMIEPEIGYAQLEMFSENSTRDLQAAIERLRGEGMRGLILDLRRNPGGLLDQGISVSDLFLDEGDAIVETRTRDPRENVTYRATHSEIVPGMPIVVLVDEYSASAAEILAGALQDHDRALVLGAPTYGKGSVQTLFPLSGGNFLKMTTGKWYTPVGRSIQRDMDSQFDRTALLEGPIGEEGEAIHDPESGDTTRREAYHTDSGRVVYGGGGIVPDLIVRPDTLTRRERAFFETASKSGNTFNDVVFAYAVEYARAHPDLERNFPVTPEMHEELYRRLQDAGVEVTREQFDGAGRLLDQRLGFEIALARWGRSAAAERANRNDSVVRRALELIRDAESTQALFSAAEAQRHASR